MKGDYEEAFSDWDFSLRSSLGDWAMAVWTGTLMWLKEIL